MRGLELAECYFRECGEPWLEGRFPEHRERIAAGLVGVGSECFGFDDEISRDHDWGPGFCLWLTAEDFREIGSRLREEWSALPASFAGFSARRESAWGSGRIGAFEIGEFYRSFIGLDRPPRTLAQWRAIPESHLATATNGKVFADPFGAFTRFREALLDFYPEDVRRKKIAARCMTIGQAGQYNFARCAERREIVAARIAEANFCSDVTSLVFLLNRRYAPFYKWAHRALEPLPLLGEAMHRLLHDLVASMGFAKKIQLMEEICAHLVDALRSQGLSDAASDALVEHGPAVQRAIRDPELRRMDVWIE